MIQLGRLVPRGQKHVIFSTNLVACGARGDVSPVEEVAAEDVFERKAVGVCVGCRNALLKKDGGKWLSSRSRNRLS